VAGVEELELLVVAEDMVVAAVDFRDLVIV
jgi:hypothetical protein